MNAAITPVHSVVPDDTHGGIYLDCSRAASRPPPEIERCDEFIRAAIFRDLHYCPYEIVDLPATRAQVFVIGLHQTQLDGELWFHDVFMIAVVGPSFPGR